MGRSARVLARGAFGAALVGATAFCGGAAFQSGGDAIPGDGGLDALGARDGAATNDGPSPPTDGPGPPGDGSASDGASIDASSGLFDCSVLQSLATTIFCADFDKGSNVGAGWSTPLAVNGGANAFDTTTFVSAPRGYASTNSATVSTVAFANLQQTQSSNATSFDLAFSMFVKTLDTSITAGPITVARLALGRSSPQALLIDLVLDKTGVHLAQTSHALDGGTLTQENNVVGALGASTWTRVQIIVDQRPATWTVRVLLDATQGLSTTAIAQPNENHVEVDVGLVFVPAPSTGNAISYDNVLLHSL